MSYTPTTSDDSIQTTRRTVLRGAAIGAGAFAVGGFGLQKTVGIAAAEEEPVIETCGEPLDVVLGIDYSGSIRNAAVWGDVRGGADQFIDVLRDQNQIGIVTFGDSPVPYEFATDDWLVPATSGNRLLAKSGVPTDAPPGENATHIPGTIDYSTDMFEAEGRGINEVLIVVTDGGPNYQNGTVGDGDDDPGTSGFQGPQDDVDITGTSLNTHTYTGGTTGGENGIAGEPGELADTTAAAMAAKARGTRVIAVVFGPTTFDSYLRNNVVSDPETDLVRTTSDQVGETLVGLLSQICEPACEECDTDGRLAKYEFPCVERDGEGDCVAYDFVLEAGDSSLVSFESFESKDGEMYEPISATFGTEYCTLYAVVKAGQEIEVQELTPEGGSATAEYVAPYAISFVEFYCTEEAANEAAEAFPSNGRGGNGKSGRD